MVDDNRHDRTIPIMNGIVIAETNSITVQQAFSAGPVLGFRRTK